MYSGEVDCGMTCADQLAEESVRRFQQFGDSSNGVTPAFGGDVAIGRSIRSIP
jgi:hypothetical protein